MTAFQGPTWESFITGTAFGLVVGVVNAFLYRRRS